MKNIKAREVGDKMDKMDKMDKLDKREISKQMAIISLALIFVFVYSCICSISSYRVFASDCDDIRQDVLRLHILANSDSERDQQLKLLVRDSIIKLDGELFKEAMSKENAQDIIKSELPKIRQTAENTLKSNGCNDSVSVNMTNMYFTTREYEEFTLPAGNYDALRVTIGAGEGHNWWCVLYPPLCLPAASKTDALSALTNDETELILGKEKYKFKFAIVEIVEKIKESIS